MLADLFGRARPVLVGIALVVIVLSSTFLAYPSEKDEPKHPGAPDLRASQIHELIENEVRTELLKHVQGLKEKDRATVYPTVAHLPQDKRKRILVTGGAGFVGSHLVDKLMFAGHDVTVVDNYFTGRRQNIAHWIGHPNFQLIVHDVVEPLVLEVDQIYHLACPASPPHYQLNPVKTIKTSTVGTINMLGLAKRVGARMLLTSTSEVYGDPREHPQRESYWGNVNPIGPRACYDEGKRVAETMMYAYHSQSGVDIRVARIFNTFGPRMHPNDGRVVSNFIIQALQGLPISVYGNGEQTRSFQFVDDLVDGLIKLMEGNYTQPVNLGNPDEFTINQFADTIKELIGSAVPIHHLPATKDDPTKRKPDITVAGRELGWAPKVHVRDGLKRTVDYFKNELEKNGATMPPGPPDRRLLAVEQQLQQGSSGEAEAVVRVA